VAFACALLQLSAANRQAPLREYELVLGEQTVPLAQEDIEIQRVTAVAFAAFFLIFAAIGALSQIFTTTSVPPDMNSYSVGGGIFPCIMYLFAAGCSVVVWGLMSFVDDEVSVFVLTMGVIGTATATIACFLSGFVFRDSRNRDNWDASVHPYDVQGQDASAR
jgi:uncharacterized membrane protein